MNINHLAIFYAVLQERSITMGAERLHISQPAVSKQLKELEENLHTTLFDRHPKGVSPTAAGLLLGDYAKKIFALESEAGVALAELDGLERGRLTIGASLTIGNYLLPQKLAAFRSLHPKIEMSVEIANTEIIQARLVDGAYDIGLTEGYAETDELNAEVFEEDLLVPIAARDHPILTSTPITLERLCQEEFVMREAGSGTREVIERRMLSRGYTLRSALSLGGIEAVKGAVVAGIGIAIVSIHSISAELAAGTLRRVEVYDFQLTRPLHLLTPRHTFRTRAAHAMTSLLMPGREA